MLINSNYLETYTGDLCLMLQTHMYGVDVDALEIFTRNGTTDTVVHSVIGEQGNAWIQRNFTVNNCGPIKVK